MYCASSFSIVSHSCFLIHIFSFILNPNSTNYHSFSFLMYSTTKLFMIWHYHEHRFLYTFARLHSRLKWRVHQPQHEICVENNKTKITRWFGKYKNLHQGFSLQHTCENNKNIHAECWIFISRKLEILLVRGKMKEMPINASKSKVENNLTEHKNHPSG